MFDSNSNLLVNNQKLKKLYRQMLRPLYEKYNFTQNELGVLMFLFNNPCFTTAKDIVDVRGLAKSHVCKSIANLSQSGYIIEKCNGNDKRCIDLYLTDKTKKITKETAKLQMQYFEILYKNITAEEKHVLTTIHNKMLENVNEVLKND